MTKPTNLFNISLLPVVLLVLLILGAGYLLMSGDINISKLLNKEPEVRRLNGFPVDIDSTVSISKQRVVIHNDQELAAFLNTVDSTGKLTLNDKVDFNKEYILGVATQSQTVKKSTVKVRKVYSDKTDKSLIVSIEQIDLGENCVLETGPNVAVDLVAISKTDWKIAFDVIRKAQPCKPQ
ncbi:MAG TPA: hypothetical protein VLI92_01765 [Candidatus Saccharimonadales bacterium]|nr:hypothetical protein [Candidatus Saccharimonadales bacterium]